MAENFHPDWLHGAFTWLSYLARQRYGHVVPDTLAPNMDYRLPGAPLDASEREVEAALDGVGLQGSSRRLANSRILTRILADIARNRRSCQIGAQQRNSMTAVATDMEWRYLH